MRNLPRPSLLRSLHSASVGLTSHRARSFTVCQMSGRSCSRNAARIAHDRGMSSRGLFLGLDFWIPASADPPISYITSSVSTPFAVSRPNPRIKRSTSSTTACRRLCFPILVLGSTNDLAFDSSSFPGSLASSSLSPALLDRLDFSAVLWLRPLVLVLLDDHLVSG